MNERRPGFAPKLRQKEIMPVAPASMEVTRINGKLYAVPEKGNDPYSGGSAYTERQCDVLIAISREHPKESKNDNEGAW